METKCANCGADLKEGTQFCPECGTKVGTVTNEKLFCENCGAEITNSENFCETCGTNLNNPKHNNTKNFLKKNKNALIIVAGILIALFLVVMVLSLFSAPTVEDVGTKVVSVGINDFEIPGDYYIEPSTIDVDYTGYNVIFSQDYSNGLDYISIGVMNIPFNVDGESVAASQGGVHKKLMGVDGYYTEDNGIYTFAFVDGAYLNVVSVTSVYVFDEITYLG